MFRLFIVILLAAALYYGWTLYSSPTWSTIEPNQELGDSKCIDSSGNTYYGQVPEGVRCVASAKVDGALSIVQSPAFIAAPSSGKATSSSRCDGRTHCSQMRSCAEARFFLENCPGVEMDGDLDGEPCETQWCN